MNILYLCADPGIPVRGHKGAAIHVRALTDALVALGHRVTLLTPRAGPADGPIPAARLVEVASPLPFDKALSAEARERLSCEIAAALYQAGRDLLAREPFDFIYERYSLWSDAGARLAQECGLPLVVEVNAPLRLEAARFRSLHLEYEAAEIERRLFSAARAVVVVSSPLREYVIGRGVPAERAHVLPNAVNERFFHPSVKGDATRARLGLAGKLVVGFVGTVKPWHDVDTLIEAMARLSAGDGKPQPYHLLLVGGIPPEVRRKVEQRGLAGATTIVEPVPHHIVPQYVAAIDVAVSPHPALEGFYFSPLKLFEYLACGVATVAADVTPVAEVVTDGMTALLYPPGDAGALAERIAGLAADAAARARLGWQGASHVLRHHTWQRAAQQVIQWAAPSPHAGQEPPREQDKVPILDDRLRISLYGATRVDVAGPLLAAHLPDGNGQTCDWVAHVEVLKYKPRRRCVLAYDLERQADDQPPSDTGHRLVGKVFRDERGAQHLAFHRQLWADGFGAMARDGICIAEPLGYIPEMRMFLQERAPGSTLDDSLGAPDFGSRVRRCAVAIAKLHGSHVQPPARYTLDDELENLDAWTAEMAAWWPDQAEAFARQLSRLRAWAVSLPQANLVPAHRDFYYSQVLFADKRLTLIDLDLFALADPAIDVANFAAHLRLLAIQRLPDPAALDGDARCFVHQYAQEAPQPPAFFERLAFYEAATYFRLMHVVLQRPRLARCQAPLFDICDRGQTLMGCYGG